MSDLFDEIASDMQTEFKRLGDLIVGEVQETLSIPVEYVTGPRSGTRIIRSKPGEYPRTETGALRTGIDHKETNAGDVVSLTVSANTEYAIFLENNLNRAFLGPAFNRWVEEVQDAAANVITGESNGLVTT